jgi:EAL domain-containing protein (putative c-di-GMP-specific phosphodiesterase class I)
VERARESLIETGAIPESIYLEIDERALVGDKGLVWQALRGAKRLGLRLALDDFGAGLTSLKHLHDLDLDLLKIDPSYVAGLGVDNRGTAVVEHVIGLAKALNVVTLAESVETEQQVESLRALGCDLAQGYYFSTPQPAHVITAMLSNPVFTNDWHSAAVPEIPNATNGSTR